jgi:hypothetical protein
MLDPANLVGSGSGAINNFTRAERRFQSSRRDQPTQADQAAVLIVITMAAGREKSPD